MDNEINNGLTDEELLQLAKKIKQTKVYDSLIVGVLIGIAIYGAAKNGLGLLTLIPLFYLPIAKLNAERRKAVQKVLEDRNLKL